MATKPTSSSPSSASTWQKPADVAGAFARLRAAARAHVAKTAPVDGPAPLYPLRKQ